MAKLRPELSFKKVSSCLPGELFRPIWAGSPLCILFTRPNATELVVVVLKGTERDSKFPFFVSIPRDDERVFSMGLDYEVEIDLNGPIDIGKYEFRNTNGVIHIFDDRWLLRVRPQRGFWNDREAFFDLATGMVADAPEPPTAIAASWAIRLQNAEYEERKTLFEFSTPTAT